jgi:hypothetical protein
LLFIVLSVEILTTFKAKKLEILIKSVNKGWNNSIPITPTCLQPNYSIGFRQEAFIKDQLKRLQPFVSKLIDSSLFIAIYYIYFLFLIYEVKCSAVALNIVDR